MSLHQDLRDGIRLQAKGKLQLLDALAAKGMEVSRISLSPGSLSVEGVFLDVLVWVPFAPAPRDPRARRQLRKGGRRDH